MLKKTILLFGTILLFQNLSFSQDSLKISLDSIPKNFIKDSHILTVENNVEVEIVNQNLSLEKVSETVLILDQIGLNSFKKGTSYDGLTKIEFIQLVIYDSEGKFVKKIEEEEFLDASLVDGFSIYNDNRIKYANVDYKTFPFFIKLEYNKKNDFTIFIQPFYALKGEKEKVLKTEYSIKYPTNFEIKAIEKNLEEYQILKVTETDKITYSGKNLQAPDFEDLNLRYLDLLPEVKFSTNHFSLSNIKGTANTWNEFGIWYQKNFLNGLDELPTNTISHIKKITSNATTDLEKVKIVFDYVQKHTRYISIQTGIGGWKPFSAKEVDKLKYGDCKALTNYTKALLNSVGVETFYTILYASNRIKDIDEDIISMQGNHVLLTYKTGNDYVFLECTSQEVPFGHLSKMTDNRKVLLITKNGAEFATTKSYNENDNQLITNFVIDLSDINKINSKGDIEFKGLFYNEIYNLNVQNKDQVLKFLKRQFSNFNDLDIINSQFENNKEEISYTEKVNFNSSFIGSKAGNEFLVPINSFLKPVSQPKKYKNRQTDFQVLRDSRYSITTKYILPEGYKLSFQPNNDKISSQFGNYELIINTNQNELIVTEIIEIKSGLFKKDEYENYRTFLTNVLLNNSSKFILTKI